MVLCKLSWVGAIPSSSLYQITVKFHALGQKKKKKSSFLLKIMGGAILNSSKENQREVLLCRKVKGNRQNLKGKLPRGWRSFAILVKKFLLFLSDLSQQVSYFLVQKTVQNNACCITLAFEKQLVGYILIVLLINMILI